MATYWENSCSFGLRYVSWYKCLIVSLVFSHLGFWSGNLFLIAPFPDLCLLVPFQVLSTPDMHSVNQSVPAVHGSNKTRVHLLFYMRHAYRSFLFFNSVNVPFTIISAHMSSNGL